MNKLRKFGIIFPVSDGKIELVKLPPVAPEYREAVAALKKTAGVAHIRLRGSVALGSAEPGNSNFDFG